MDGIEVAMIRRRLGLTQAEFAKRVGVSRRTVEGWEQGLRGVGPESEKKIREVMEVKDEIRFHS